MSSNATLLLARRSMRARIGRLIAISFAILIGVAFVVGTFVLADSFRKGFTSLFSDLNESIDLQVRSELAFGDPTAERDPVDQSIAATLEDIPGVARVEGTLQRNAVIVDADGDAVATGGAPTVGISWDTANANDAEALRIKGEGTPPAGPDEVAIDKATADRADFEVGDEITVITDTGADSYRITALVGAGDSDGFFGASLAAFEPATAADVFGAAGVYDTIDLRVDEGADLAAVQAAVQDVIPAGTEVVDQETLNDEATSQIDDIVNGFRTGLSIFAFVTAFVSAFLINNVFAITIGQRLRELALLRAIGGGGGQVRRLIVSEALIMSIIATILGIGGGILVAKGMIAVFNAAGAGFPDMPTVLSPFTVVMAFLVGVGVTMAAVVIPARRASRIPPVAAMRPELGFDAINTRRLVGGTVTFVAGVVMTAIGLFVRPGGTTGLIVLGGGGALLLFVGAASVSSTIAKPVTRIIGAPVAKVYGAPGQLAQQNAGRAPRRTSATAATLMISVALVSAASVFGASISKSFREAFETGVTGDYVVTGQDGFGLLPTEVGATLDELPEVAAATGVRINPVQIDGESKDVGIANTEALPQLIDVGVTDGGFEGMTDDGLMIQEDVADDEDLAVGDTVEVLFQNGQGRTLTVRGLYEHAELAGNWLMSSEVVDAVVSADQQDFFVFLKLADGVSDLDARNALERALQPFPQAELNTTNEFVDDQVSQIDQLLVIITVLLGFSIAIAVLGISITLGLAVFERTREIGLMRAVGMTKRQTRKMVRWEAIIVSTFGALIGIVLGTALGVAIVLALPDTFVDTVALQPSIIVTILIGAVAAGTIAALYPAAKASRMNVLEAIATE